MAYGIEILTYLSDFKTRIKTILEGLAALDGWIVYPYRNLSTGNKYIAIWHGTAGYAFGQGEQWVTKTITIHIDVVGGFRTEGFQTNEASDVHLAVDDVIPAIEMALLSAFLDGFITDDFTDPPEYLAALYPELTNDSGELTVRASGVNGQVIGESFTFDVDVQLNITGA